MADNILKKGRRRLSSLLESCVPIRIERKRPRVIDYFSGLSVPYRTIEDSVKKNGQGLLQSKRVIILETGPRYFTKHVDGWHKGSRHDSIYREECLEAYRRREEVEIGGSFCVSGKVESGWGLVNRNKTVKRTGKNTLLYGESNVSSFSFLISSDEQILLDNVTDKTFHGEGYELIYCNRWG